MASAGRCKGTENSGMDIQYVAENVYKDLLIKHVRVGSIIGRMSFPQEHHEAVNRILALESQQEYHKATTEFLRLLHTHGEMKDYLLFVQLLEQADYVYLPQLLRGESTLDPDTHEEHCRLLTFFSQDISEKVDFNLLCPKLVEGEWMDTEDKQLLDRLASSNGMTWASKWLVYYVLPKRKENWLKQFLQVLRDLDYDCLAEWITGEPLPDSGAAYTQENNLDAPPMRQIDESGPSPVVLTANLNIIQRDFRDDVSDISSVDDNTMSGFDETGHLTDVRENNAFQHPECEDRVSDTYTTDYEQVSGTVRTYEQDNHDTQPIRPNTVRRNTAGGLLAFTNNLERQSNYSHAAETGNHSIADDLGSDIRRIDIGNDCYVTVSIWRDTLRIHIRKFYQNNGNYCPSKKGIALTQTQWNILSTVRDDVDGWKADVIAGRTVNMSRDLGSEVSVSVKSRYPGVGIRWFRNSRATNKGIHLSFEQWRRVCECLVMPELEDIVFLQH